MQEIQTASGQWAVPERRGQHKAAALEAKNSSQNFHMFYYAALQHEHDSDLYDYDNLRTGVMIFQTDTRGCSGTLN